MQYSMQNKVRILSNSYFSRNSCKNQGKTQDFCGFPAKIIQKMKFFWQKKELGRKNWSV